MAAFDQSEDIPCAGGMRFPDHIGARDTFNDLEEPSNSGVGVIGEAYGTTGLAWRRYDDDNVFGDTGRVLHSVSLWYHFAQAGVLPPLLLLFGCENSYADMQ